MRRKLRMKKKFVLFFGTPDARVVCAFHFLISFSSFTFQDKMGFWYSNPGTFGSGGVGKYLKERGRKSHVESVDVDATDLQPLAAAAKKRKSVVSTAEFKNFSAW